MVNIRRFGGIPSVNRWVSSHLLRCPNFRSLGQEIYERGRKMQNIEYGEAGSFYLPPAAIQNEARVKSMDQYREMYKKSVEDPAGFWGEIAKQYHWESPQTGEFLSYNFDYTKGPISIKCLEGAKTNICYNAVNRHVENGRG